MKTVLTALAGAVLAAGSAQAQWVTPLPAPALQAAPSATVRNLPTFPRLEASSQGLGPADPAAPDLYRPDPKLVAAVAFNPIAGVEATFTNRDYVERLTYIGGGPRLAQGVPLAVGGYDLKVAARMVVPVDDRLSGFGRLGMAVSQRDQHKYSTSDIGPAASVGGSYKLGQGQSATVEIPLDPIERRQMSGSKTGYGARLKLGF